MRVSTCPFPAPLRLRQRSSLYNLSLVTLGKEKNAQYENVFTQITPMADKFSGAFMTDCH